MMICNEGTRHNTMVYVCKKVFWMGRGGGGGGGGGG